MLFDKFILGCNTFGALKFYHQENENFMIQNSDIFLISAQNIDYGYSLEPPRRGGSNEYPKIYVFE